MSLLKRIFKRYKKDQAPVTKQNHIVTFIGEAFAGKTTILHRLRTGEFYGNTARTMGLNVDNFSYRDITFQAFDLGGQETFREIWGNYLKLSHAVVFVIDCSNPNTFQSSKEVLYRALPDIPPNSVLLVVANKSDLSGVDPYVMLLQHFNLFEIQQEGHFRAVNVFHMSAKTGTNFYQAFDWLIEALTGVVVMPKVTVHNVCIYRTGSGLLVGTSSSEGETSYDPSMLTSMFSAVNKFAQASLGAGVREILMKQADGFTEVSEDYKLVRVEESDFSVILIVNESDSMRKSVKIGKDLLNWTRMQIPIIDIDDFLEPIDEIEIQTFLKLKYPDDFSTISI